LKQYLLTAGPTPVPERVLLALARPMLYHRAPAFTECLKETQEGLKWLFQTRQIVLQLAGSGTLAMEAAVSNFLRRGEKALVIRGGKFGERWAKITQAYGIETVTVDVEWGKGVDPLAVAAALDQDPGIRAVSTRLPPAEDHSRGRHIRNRPNAGSGSGVRLASSSARPSTVRVSAGSMIPSSHSRAVEWYGLPWCSYCSRIGALNACSASSDHASPRTASWSRFTVESTDAACSPPITEMRAFGHIQRKLGPKARPHMP